MAPLQTVLIKQIAQSCGLQNPQERLPRWATENVDLRPRRLDGDGWREGGGGEKERERESRTRKL